MADGALGQPVSGEVQRVADAVLTRIVAGDYPAGLRLPSETDLAAAYHCGRSTVREALRHLTALGVVKSRRGSGALVLDFRREGTPALLPSYVMAGRFDRPADVLARELLGIRTLLAAQAVRLAALYAERGGVAEARAILAKAPSLAADPVAHGMNELSFFRALVVSSGIWPAVWLANVFWAPMRDLHGQLAAFVGQTQKGYQATMERLLDHIEAREAHEAERLVVTWFTRVDEGILAQLSMLLAAAKAPSSPPPKPARAGKRTSSRKGDRT